MRFTVENVYEMHITLPCPAILRGGVPPTAGDALYRLSYNGAGNGEIISKDGFFVKSGYPEWGMGRSIDKNR